MAPQDGVSQAFDRSDEYSIRRAPDLLTISPGAEVRYTCAHRSGHPPTAIGGPSSYRDVVRWYKFSARSLLEETRGKDAGWAVPIQKGPAGEFAWRCRWNDAPGRYVVGSEISDGGDSTFCFLPQYVEAAGRVAARSLDELLASGTGPSPEEAEQRIARHLANLKAIERRFPLTRPEDRREHEEAVGRWKKYHMALRRLLAPTEGKPRLAVRAMHLETTTQARRPLLLFLCHAGDDVVGRARRRRPRWALVDWTDPSDGRYHGTYQGAGDTDAEAIDEALASWDRGNRYPGGLVTYELPAPAEAGRRALSTDGKSRADEVKGTFEWIALGGLVVAGALVLFTPVPVLVSGALGTSLLSSTAAAGISIGQRWHAGVFDWRQDAFDGLTIISALFTAGAAAWVRGARVILRDEGGRAVTRVFIGARAGADLVQGVLVGEESLREWDELTAHPELLPEERARRLLALFRNLAATGLLGYVNLRATAGELANLGQRPRHVADEGQARASGEKLDALTNPSATVDTTRSPLVEGHAREERHRTTVTIAPPLAPRILKPEETAFAKFYRKKDHPWRELEITRTHLFLFDKDGYSFEASCVRGTLSITILTAVGPDSAPYIRRRFRNPRVRVYSEVLWAKELYPLMYQHFEEVGNRVKKLKGPWAWDNYSDAKTAYDRLVNVEQLSPREAAKIAVLHARTWLKFHKEQGLTEVLWAELDETSELFDFEIGRPR